MSDRPVYTKSRSTKRNKTARLHGAFQGGFSAGHFNTVGSKKGWKPSYDDDDEEDVTTKDVEGDYYARPEWRTKARSNSNLSSVKGRKKQTINDFMDEEDENLFGGPDNVNDEFSHDVGRNTSKQNINSDKSIEDLLSGDFSRIKGEGSIGKRLLRVLGWREQNNGSSYIYAPMEKNKNENDDSIILSKKIKRIQVKLSKQTLRDLPHPKLDTYGLDYDPFHMAPEFRAHKEMRKKRAEMRAKSAASTDGSGRMNVYRTNDIMDGEDDMQVSRKENHDNSSGVLAYETADDFIGSTTVGGFALHDDDDDVYDNQMGLNQKKNGKLNINKEDYHHEIYDASDSEVEDLIDDGMPKHESEKVNDFASSLSIWTGNSGKSMSGKTAVTSDGKPPMKGFVLAKGSMKTINMKRFPGPDLPLDYSPVPHDFGTSEKIEGIKNLSTNMSLDMLRARRNARTGTEDENGDGQSIQRSLKPMAGGSFAALAESLKDRFTTSTKSNHASKDSSKEHTDPTKVTIHRKTTSWQPSVLLCKRMNVAFPGKNGKSLDVIETKSGIHASLEENFFQNEILGKIGNGSVPLPPKTEAYKLSGENFDVLERPTMEIMKSIFEDDSENDDVMSDIDDTDNIDSVKKDVDCKNNEENVSKIRTNAEEEVIDTISSKTETDIVEDDVSEYSSDSGSERGRKRERKHHRRKHRKGEKKKRHRKYSRSEKRKKRHKK